jgi:release factor glutamine methyltransferase
VNLAAAMAVAAQAGVARLDAQLLLLHTLGRDESKRAWLLANDAHELSSAQERAYVAALARRASGEPLAYVLGQWRFAGLMFEVNAHVLVPRPETEVLVRWALEVGPVASTEPGRTIVDLGTGSGAIAVALAVALSASLVARVAGAATVVATDLSAEALAVAGRNAQRHGVALTLAPGPWWDAVAPQARFDLAVSNPPYIAEGDPHLAALRHEPAGALSSGRDGLHALTALIDGAPAHLHPGGWLLLEHGHDQAPAVRALLNAQGFDAIETRVDLAGLPRCSGGRWQG